MTLQVQCPQCAKQFKAKPELAGKRVKCSQCQAIITIPGGAAAAPAGATPQRRPAAPQQRMAPLMPMQSAAPPMGSILDLLADSTLGELKSAPMARQGEMLCPACQAVCPMGAALCTSCGLDFRDGKVIGFEEQKKKNPQTKALIQALIAATIVVISLALTSVFVALVGTKNLGFLSNPIAKFTEAHKDFPLSWINFGYAGLFVGGILMVLFFFSLLADAFTAGKAHGWLFLFVPGYAVYFLATHWKETRKTFVGFIVGGWLVGFGWLVQMNSFVPKVLVDPSKKKKKSAIERPYRLAQGTAEQSAARPAVPQSIDPREVAIASLLTCGETGQIVHEAQNSRGWGRFESPTHYFCHRLLRMTDVEMPPTSGT